MVRRQQVNVELIASENFDRAVADAETARPQAAKAWRQMKGVPYYVPGTAMSPELPRTMSPELPADERSSVLCPRNCQADMGRRVGVDPEVAKEIGLYALQKNAEKFKGEERVSYVERETRAYEAQKETGKVLVAIGVGFGAGKLLQWLLEFAPEGVGAGQEIWRATTASRPLSAMGHAAKHLPAFQKLDAALTADDVAKILEYVRATGTPSPGQFGAREFAKEVFIGGKNVVVKVIESSSKIIKSGWPVE